MEINNQPIHLTVTHIVRDGEQEEWEFVCPICGYRAYYTPNPKPGRQQLEVLVTGDPQARHTSNGTPQTPLQVQTTGFIEGDSDESWLTPELRQQWEELLADVDIDDW